MSSGSTGGGPKGVLSTWVCLGAFVPHGADALQLDATAHWAEPSHPSYDLAMTNLVLALASGASVHVSGSLGDRLRPLAFVTRVGATHVRLAPRYIDLAANEKKVAEAPDLRVWGSGGDRLSALHAARILELGIPTLVNTYGTSETAGFASAAVFTPSDDPMSVHGTVSIGVGELGPWRTELVTESMADEPALMLAISSPYLRNGYLFGGSREGYPTVGRRPRRHRRPWGPGGRRPLLPRTVGAPSQAQRNVREPRRPRPRAARAPGPDQLHRVDPRRRARQPRRGER